MSPQRRVVGLGSVARSMTWRLNTLRKKTPPKPRQRQSKRERARCKHPPASVRRPKAPQDSTQPHALHMCMKKQTLLAPLRPGMSTNHDQIKQVLRLDANPLRESLVAQPPPCKRELKHAHPSAPDKATAFRTQDPPGSKTEGRCRSSISAAGIPEATPAACHDPVAHRARRT